MNKRNILFFDWNVLIQYLIRPNFVNIFLDWNDLPMNAVRGNKLILIKMNIFELLRKHFAMCGIAISQQSRKYYPFNVENTTVLIINCIFVSLTTILLTEVNTFVECTNILYKGTSIGVCGILYVCMVWKTSNLLEFINSLADTVEESE